MPVARRFNRSAFGRFLNSRAGRVFRVVGGSCFIALGVWLGFFSLPGLAAIAWGLLALSAGGLDVCWFSLALGGPFRGAACRADAGAPHLR
jgi:hypothetical protein